MIKNAEMIGEIVHRKEALELGLKAMILKENDVHDGNEDLPQSQNNHEMKYGSDRKVGEKVGVTRACVLCKVCGCYKLCYLFNRISCCRNFYLLWLKLLLW